MGHLPHKNMIIGTAEFNAEIETITDSYFEKKKLKAIKAVKEVTGFGLKEAKDLTDNLFSYIDVHVEESHQEVSRFVCKRLQGILEVQPENKQFEKNVSDFAKIGKIANQIAGFINDNPDFDIEDVMGLLRGVVVNKIMK